MSGAPPPPEPPPAGGQAQEQAPVFQPVVVAGGWVRRGLANPTLRNVLLGGAIVAFAYWWLDGGKGQVLPDVRSAGATKAQVEPDNLPAKPPATQAAAPAALPDAEPRRPDPQPAAFRPAQPPGPPPALVSGKGQVRATPPPDSTLRSVAYAPPPAPASAESRGGVAYKAPTIPGWEVVAIGDIERTLMPATDIPCTLDRAMDGTHPGEFTCIIARDIYGGGFPPTVALLRAGDTITGSYQPLAAGEQRILGLSAYAMTYVGGKALYVPLGGAPVEDSIGRAGMAGYVENRFWERLGNAIITDIGSQAVRLPAGALQATAGGYSLGAGTTERIVEDTLRGQANATRPLFRKNQGDAINVRITAPVHFGVLRYEAAR